MENISLVIPKSHLEAFEEMSGHFSITLLSKKEMPETEVVQDPFYMVNVLVDDYSILYLIGYGIGVNLTHKELRPIITSCSTQFFDLASKIKKLEYYEKILDDYNKGKEVDHE